MIWGIIFIIAILYLLVWLIATGGVFTALAGFAMIYCIMYVMYLDWRNRV